VSQLGRVTVTISGVLRMAIRASIIVATTSFIIGTLATHFVADSLTLWQSPVTDERLFVAAQYYVLLSQTPIEIFYVIGFITALGTLMIAWSLFDGGAGNLMFDGGSLFLYISAISVYIYQVIPTLMDNFPQAPIQVTLNATKEFPTYLKKPTMDLASSHLVCSVIMTGVLFLQAGKWWADGEDRGWKDDEGTLKKQKTQ